MKPLALAVSLCLFACSSGKPAPLIDGSAVVSREGGTVSLSNGPSLQIPAGALFHPITITIENTGRISVAGTPIFRFGPEGLAFASAVTVIMPPVPSLTAASLYWTQQGSTTEYETREGTITAGGIQAQITHFSSGYVGPPCLLGSGCPTGNPCHLATMMCASGAPVCAENGMTLPDGITCGAQRVCRGGACIPACTGGDPCSPASAAACKAYATSCDASGNKTCAVAGDLPGGTGCGGGNVCSFGACVAPTHTVAGQFTTVFAPDDGTRTSKPTPPLSGNLNALLSHGFGAGYQSFPIALGADQSFSVANVPAGPYLLRFDGPGYNPAATGPVIQVSLLELTTGAPDLSTVVSSRPDVAHTTDPNSAGTQIAVSATGLDPWVTSDRLILVSSQASAFARFFGCNSNSKPAVGATTFTGTLAWFCTLGGGLPSAAKADPVFFFQRVQASLGTGASAAIATSSIRYARVTDLTVADAATTNETLALGAVQQSGSVAVAVKGSQFAALKAQVNPGAQPLAQNAFAMGISTSPHSIAYPDQPDLGASIFEVDVAGDASTDLDYGTLHYGQFLDPQWKEYRFVSYQFDVYGTYAQLVSQVPMSPAPTGPIVPVLGPPATPLVGGKDAFRFQSGVGLQPLISWSAPSLGSATSYVIQIDKTDAAVAGEVRSITATIHSGTSFEVPAGLLKARGTYQMTITAQQGPAWDALDHAPFRRGLPFHQADCVTAGFSP